MPGGNHRGFTATAVAVLAAVCLSPATGQAQTITRGPLIQNPDALTTTMTFLWWTNVAGNGTVEYGLTPALGSSQTQAQQGSCEVGSAGTCHRVTLTGLQPGTRYYYRLLTNGVEVQAQTYFQTMQSPSDPNPLFFTVIGDWGQGTTGEQQVANLQNTDDPPMIVTVGDNTYTNGTQSELDNNGLAYYRSNFSRALYYPTLGNHDLNDVGGAGGYASSAHAKTFTLPLNGVEPERYYSFENGDALFVSIDSDNCCDSTQRNWLENVLATTTRKWKFVFLHHTPYSCANGLASFGSNTTVRNSWGPLFEQYGVDIVFTGHDHIYERTKLIDDYVVGGGSGSDGLGTRYVMTGGGGATLDQAANVDSNGPYRQPLFGSRQNCYWVTQSCPLGPGGYCSFSRYSYTWITITNDDTLTLKAIDNNGTLIDTMVITKGVPSTPTPTSTNTAQPTPTDTPPDTPTQTPVFTPVNTRTLTPTRTPTPTPTQTPTGTFTRTSTATPSITDTATTTPTFTATATPTATGTVTSTNTPAPTATSSPTPTATPPLTCSGANSACVPGGGSALADCNFEWYVLAPTTLDPRGLPKTRFACTDGDTACDGGTQAGSCTFRVALCLNDTDTRLPLCMPSAIASFEIIRPRSSSTDATDQAHFGALLSQLGSGPSGFGLTVFSGGSVLNAGAPKSTADLCSAPLDIAVPLRMTAGGSRPGRRVLKVSANSTSGMRDRDKLILQCLP